MIKDISLSGFTIVRNIEKYEYPVKESILSLLPLVDELVISIGKSEDNTEKIIKSIDSDKIKLFYREWDDRKREGGEVLSIETNYALGKIKGDWGFYLQADEVLHEEEYLTIKNDLIKAHSKNKDAVSFRYYHFKGDYWSINPWAYRREIRLIKKNSNLISVGDACTFARPDGEKTSSFKSRASIYHYGWVKTPQTMVFKTKNMDSWYHDDDYVENKFQRLTDKNIFDDVKILRIFKKSHPKIMEKRIAKFPAFPRLRPRWWYKDFYKKFLKYGCF